jgi:hypothetical protein
MTDDRKSVFSLDGETALVTGATASNRPVVLARGMVRGVLIHTDQAAENHFLEVFIFREQAIVTEQAPKEAV